MLLLRRFASLALGLCLALGAPVQAQEAPAEPDPGESTVVFLVRHAEKVEDGSRDPTLTPEGEERARKLARVLADAGLTRVLTSDYRRTRRTAAPAAKAHGLEPVVYDAGDLEALAARLRAAPGRHLVVGHSNTTPRVVELLGGDPGGPIDEEHEYDRLYVVVLHPGGRATTTLLRYGAP